jgi:hypothetical protein
MSDARGWGYTDFAMAMVAPWVLATAAGVAATLVRYDRQGYLGSLIFAGCLTAYAGFTKAGSRAPAIAFVLGMILTPILIVAAIAASMATGVEAISWLAAGANVGYHPHLGPDFDGVGVIISWCGIFALVSGAALVLRQTFLLYREDRLSRKEQSG